MNLIGPDTVVLCNYHSFKKSSILHLLFFSMSLLKKLDTLKQYFMVFFSLPIGREKFCGFVTVMFSVMFVIVVSASFINS